MRKLLSVLLFTAAMLLPTAALGQQNPPSNQSFVGGRFVARNYNYVPIAIAPGVNIPVGAGTITLHQGSVRLADGRTIVPFSAGGYNILGQPGTFPAIPIYVGAGTTRELVTPTAVSGCYTGAPVDVSCKITATFANAHGTGEVVTSGSYGVQEAINDAAFWGGGMVEVDSSENFYEGGAAGVTAAIGAAIVMPNVSVVDDRGLAPLVWNPQGGLTAIAAPAILTAVTALPSTTPVGAYGTGTYHMCISYLDLLGQEGACSPDFSQAGLATGSFIFSPPAASTDAIGYKIYIGLTAGGVTNLDYAVPLTSTICTLTTLTTIPACAVTNTTYGQVGATATVTAITVNTSPINPAVTATSTTSVYTPNAGGRTAYAYVPGSHMGTPGVPALSLPFTIGAATATIVPEVIGTINVAPGLMNVVGRTIRVCGYATTTATAATIVDIEMQWDSFGQNTAGKGVVIADLSVVPVAAFSSTAHLSFCQDFVTTVAGAGATAGSILPLQGFLNGEGVVKVAAGQGAGAEALTGAIASLNLASEARINIDYLHTTATDGAGFTLQDVSIQVVN